MFDSKGIAGWATSETSGVKRFVGTRLRSIAGGDDGKGGMAGSSFDVRRGVLGAGLKLASTATGFNFGGDSKFLMREAGGYEADLKRRDAKRKARADGLKTKEGEEEKQTLNQYEEEHQELSLKHWEELHKLDIEIESADGKAKLLTRAAANNPALYGAQADTANKELFDLREKKKKIAGGRFNEETGKYNTHNGNITKGEYEGAIKLAKETTDIHTAAIAEKTAAETAAKMAEEATRTTRFGGGDAKAIEDALKAETEAKARLATATTNADSAVKNMTEKAGKLAEAETKKKEADAAGGFGRSINDYVEHYIPEQKHKVEEVGNKRARAYADNEAGKWWSLWNEAARKKSAHVGAKLFHKDGGATPATTDGDHPKT